MYVKVNVDTACSRYAETSTPAQPKDSAVAHLDGKSLDLLLESLDLARKLGQLVGADAGGNNGAAHTTSTSEQSLARDVDVRDALVFADKRDVEDDSEGLGIGSKDGNLASTTVDSLGDCKPHKKSQSSSQCVS
jgi:hypothetical protein